jgi:hypothetical protein
MKFFYGVIIASIIALSGIYYSYSQHYLVSYEEKKAAAAQNFRDELISFRTQLRENDRNIFEAIYQEKNAKITVKSYFIDLLKLGLDYEILAPNYLDCSRSVIRAVRESNQNLITIENIKRQLKASYGDDYDKLYNRLVISQELVYKTRSFHCDEFFPELELVVYNSSVWSNIQEHLAELKSIAANVERSRATARNALQNMINNNIMQFRSSYRSTFRNRIERESALLIQNSMQEYVIDIGGFSPTILRVEATTFNENHFNSVLQQELTAQWNNNSLTTGARPYANCFPATNNCSGLFCSEIRVNNSGSDVIVTVKDRSGRVVRHAFIQGNNSFSFHLPDGTYQTFFYSGRGWNPNKSMTSSTCSQLRGGFVSNENFSKDPSFDNLRRDVVTYTLTPTRSGNFNTTGSSASQNF